MPGVMFPRCNPVRPEDLRSFKAPDGRRKADESSHFCRRGMGQAISMPCASVVHALVRMASAAGKRVNAHVAQQALSG